MKGVARWPGYTFNACFEVGYWYAMCRDMPMSIYNVWKVEMGVEWMA